MHNLGDGSETTTRLHAFPLAQSGPYCVAGTRPPAAPARSAAAALTALKDDDDDEEDKQRLP